jgi:predicted GTPase
LTRFYAVSSSIRDRSNDALIETMGAVSAPLHLLTVDAERKLQVNEAALQELRQYNCSLKIVGVLGAYRTGKSYLLNLLFDRPDGFKLGSTVKGETRGVWIAVRRSTVPGAPAIALLDTEGLSDVENPDEDYDSAHHDHYIAAVVAAADQRQGHNRLGHV